MFVTNQIGVLRIHPHNPIFTKSWQQMTDVIIMYREFLVALKVLIARKAVKKP